MNRTGSLLSLLLVLLVFFSSETLLCRGPIFSSSDAVLDHYDGPDPWELPPSSPSDDYLVEDNCIAEIDIDLITDAVLPFIPDLLLNFIRELGGH